MTTLNQHCVKTFVAYIFAISLNFILLHLFGSLLLQYYRLIGSCLVSFGLVGITDAFSNILKIPDHQIKIRGQLRQYNYDTDLENELYEW